MRKRVVFADESGLADAIGLIDSIVARQDENEEVPELHGVGPAAGPGVDAVDVGHPFFKRWDVDDEDSLAMLADFLRAQPIGTKVSLFLARPHWKVLHRICSSVGLSAEEIEGAPYGPMLERVFCIGCYQYNPPTLAERIVCAHCGRGLSVSAHYSRRLDAVIGYLTIDQVLEVIEND